MNKFFVLLMILRQAKNPRSGRARAPGGSARQEAGDPPPNGRAVEFLFADRTRGPLWAEWPIPRAFARVAGGGAGEGKPQVLGLQHGQDVLGNRSVPAEADLASEPAVQMAVSLSSQRTLVWAVWLVGYAICLTKFA